MSESPIGIFDSGVGGLTVVKAVHRLLPQEEIIYFGDTARVPYGNKSPATVIRYGRQISQFLINRKVKAIAVACNTATAHALPTLQRDFSLPILGVVEPGVEAALAATRNGRIGIIATAGTVQSGAYPKALLARRENLSLTSQAAPLLVSLIEENWLDHAATELILKEYLSPFQQAKIDTLILGCTHYPLLKEKIASILGKEIRLVDSAENMAAALAAKLKEKNLLSEKGKEQGKIQVCVSDLSLQFVELAKRFLGKEVGEVEEVGVE